VGTSTFAFGGTFALAVALGGRFALAFGGKFALAFGGTPLGARIREIDNV